MLVPKSPGAATILVPGFRYQQIAEILGNRDPEITSYSTFPDCEDEVS
jgi:hypothetical protein